MVCRRLQRGFIATLHTTAFYNLLRFFTFLLKLKQFLTILSSKVQPNLPSALSYPYPPVPLTIILINRGIEVAEVYFLYV